MQALARGIAGAADETGMLDKANVRDWLTARETAVSCTISHIDLLARPQR